MSINVAIAASVASDHARYLGAATGRLTRALEVAERRDGETGALGEGSHVARLRAAVERLNSATEGLVAKLDTRPGPHDAAAPYVLDANRHALARKSDLWSDGPTAAKFHGNALVMSTRFASWFNPRDREVSAAAAGVRAALAGLRGQVRELTGGGWFDASI